MDCNLFASVQHPGFMLQLKLRILSVFERYTPILTAKIKKILNAKHDCGRVEILTYMDDHCDQ